MSPQFVDFDGDGRIDIVTATYDGSPHVALGTAEGFAAPAHVLDRNGRRVMLDQFWDYAKSEWHMAANHCVSAAVFDWDGDGDLDLLLGAYDGGLFREMNEGRAGAPAFTGEYVAVMAGDRPLVVDGGLTAPRLVDWDGDGLMDLVCGGFHGGVSLYRNTGAAGAPRFAPAETLVPVAKNTDSGLRAPNAGVYADPVDVDGDGDLDLLVGGYAEWTPSHEPTAAEQARLVQLEERHAALQEEVQRRVEAASQKGEDPAAAVQEMVTEIQAVQDELRELSPGPKRQAGVWWYERR